MRIKDHLAIEAYDRETLIELLRLSPSALLWALNKDEMLCGHRGKSPELDRIMAANYARYYRGKLLSYAIDNFNEPTFGRFMHEACGLRELEFNRRAVFKSATGQALEVNVAERFGIARGDETIGGGLIRVWLLEKRPGALVAESDTIAGRDDKTIQRFRSGVSNELCERTLPE